MEIALERIEPISYAYRRLRKTPLAGTEDIFYYRDAKMRFASFHPEELHPTSRYVLRGSLEFQRELRRQLLKKSGVDIFQLKGVIHYRVDGELWGMAPPVVELHDERVRIVPLRGDHEAPPERRLKIKIIPDGLHRIYLAREANVRIRCIFIHGVSAEQYPFPSYPVSWDEVGLCDVVPAPAEKRFFRKPGSYEFSRPLQVLRQIGDIPLPDAWGRK